MEQADHLTTLDTVSKRVKFLAERCPDKELFVFYQGDERTSFTCEQVFRLAGKFAYRLRHLFDFAPRDVIANTLPNSPERMIADLGVTLAGCTCMNGQILLADGSDFFRSAKNSRCRGIVLKPNMDSAAWRLLHPYITGEASSALATLSCDQTPDLTSAICVSRTAEEARKPWLEELRDSNEEVFVDATTGPEDLLYVFTTSGSTGYSKLVPRSHGQAVRLVSSGEVSSIDFSASNGNYCDYSLGWIGGYPFVAYSVGQKRVLQDWFNRRGRKTGEEIWKTICREKCSSAGLRQVDVESVVRYIDGVGGPDFKLPLLFTGGQPVTQTQAARGLSIAEKVFLSYGSTECGLLSMAIVEDADAEDYYCGKIMPGSTLKIVDVIGDECKPKQPGTILVQAGKMFKGYFNLLQDPDPDTVKCFTKDGWFNTEDVGYQDEAGNLYVMGRNKDTIMYGSVVLYPGWLEAEILQHPEVADALVLPVSDPLRFHEICACVTPVSGSCLNEEQLKAHCESIFIADLANEMTPMPKYFMVLQSFPETPSGKPDKVKLRQLVEEKFGADRGKHALL